MSEIEQLHARIRELEAQAAGMRAALEEISRGEGRYSRDPLEHADNCIENMKAIANAALSPDAGRRVAEVVEAAMKVCRLLASIAENTAEEEVEFVQPGDKMISKGKVVLSRDDWDVVSEACRLAVSALDAGKEGGA